MLTADQRRKMARRAKRQARNATLSPEQRLAAQATKLLRKSGFYPRNQREKTPVNADMIATHGGLKATWIGRP